MFIRKNKNRSGSISVQIISKENGKYRVLETVGTGKTEQEIEYFYQRAKIEIQRKNQTPSIFVNKEDAYLESFLTTIGNTQIQVIGPELIFGKIFDSIGFNQIGHDLFRHLVITRLYQPGSKLKTIDYMQRFMNITKSVDEIYRFLDKLNKELKPKVEEIAYEHTKKNAGGNISIVFYDMTTLHFESQDEDDLRKTGFSKVGLHHNPQIYLGLLIGLQGFAIGYDIFEGNIFEGHTLLPMIQKYEKRYNLNKPIIVADAGLLSNSNIQMLQKNDYHYILGGRIKNESKEIKRRIMQEQWNEGDVIKIKKNENQNVIVSYSSKRARKDSHNRKRGLNRLEKSIKKGNLTKSHINNRGYNKYLRIEGNVKIEIDYEKFDNDAKWDGLKGYITNTDLKPDSVIENYSNLWQIEKAFRISKTDLQIRPIYHRLKNRIEGHICISFTAYCIYKELERILKKEKSSLSVKRAADLTHNMYQLNIILPESKQLKSILLNMSREQSELYSIIMKNF